jgi:hypothetical protein
MPSTNDPTDVAIEDEPLDFESLYDVSIDSIVSPISGVLGDPTMYFDQVTTTTVSPMLYDYLFSFGKPAVAKPIKKKFDAQSLKDAYTKILKTAESARERRSHKRVPRQVAPFSTLQRPWVQPRRVVGILDKRAPPEFRFNNFVLISLPVFSVASTGSTGKTTFESFYCKIRHYVVYFSSPGENILMLRQYLTFYYFRLQISLT